MNKSPRNIAPIFLIALVAALNLLSSPCSFADTPKTAQNSRTSMPARIAKTPSLARNVVVPLVLPASVTTISILDIGTFTDYNDSNTSDTFTGTGFVGMYADSWAHLLGVEYAAYSRTMMQADISSFAGGTVNSAILSFDLLDCSSNNSHGIRATVFNNDPGNLTYSFNPPATNYGSVDIAVNGCGGTYSVDLTSLIAQAVADGVQWVGIHLEGTDNSEATWTYTWTGFGYGPDRANVRLAMDVSPHQCAPPPPNMTAWWRGDGNADDSVGGHNGSLMEGATFGTGEVNQAFSFDGNGAHVAVGDVDVGDTFTIDAWINPTDLSSNPRIFSKDDDTTARGYEFRATAAGYLEATVTNGANGLTFYRTNTAPIVAGSFQHVAVTYEGGAGANAKFQFYVNGVNIPASPVIGNDAGGTPNNNSVSAKIGIAGNNQTGPFNGFIDEVEIFSRVLSLGEIAGIYAAGPSGKCECTPPPDGMIGWWPGEGNGADIQGGNTVSGSASYAAGEVNEAFSFDGSGYLTAGNADSLRLTGPTVTLDAWVNPATSGQTAIIAGKTASGFNDYLLLLDNGLLKAGIKVGGVEYFIEGAALPAETWTHVALTYEGATGAFKLFINGVVVANATASGNLDGTSSEFAIGGRSGEYFLNGLVDEVEVFGTALADSDIRRIYRAGSAGKCRPCVNPPGGMTHWWTGDNNANDLVGPNTGTLKNGATFAVGKVAQAFNLDGSNDYVDVRTLDLPGTFTIDAWINPTTTSTNQWILANSDSLHGFDFYLFHSKLEAKVFNANGTTDYVSVGNVVAGQWQHVAVTYDENAPANQRFTFYINGVPTTTSVFGDTGGSPDPSGNTAKIGTVGAANGNFFSGLIDEVEVFNTVLSGQDIQSIYNADSAGKCKPAGPAERQLANISSRVDVGAGENVGIGGFIIRTDPPSRTVTSRKSNGDVTLAGKQVLIRGLGPSLQVGGNPLPDRLMDPVLDLYDSNGTLIEHNDNWMEQPDGVFNPARTASIQGTGLAPSDPNEAAILRNLVTDSTYTAILSGKDESTGIGLVEVYDMEPTIAVHLGNISTRGFVSTGDNVLIGGFIVEGGVPTRLLLRAIGPSLPPSIANPLQDPVLELHDGNGALMERNDDWMNSPEATDIGAILPPDDPKESAILFTPAPGVYTAIVSGNNPNPTGIALVEVYRVSNP